MGRVDHFLEGFFNPRSVAVVGATENPYKVNYRLLQNLVTLDFDGRLYPVNPNSKQILGLKAYRRLQDIPEEVDLVVSAVPAPVTIDIARDCDEIGVKQLVIVTGGFSEGGAEGQRLHDEIASYVEEKGIRTLGPNTLSPLNTARNFTVSYNPVNEMRRGSISLVFQSGLYDPRLNWVFSQFGLNKALDLGNKMNIDEVDALEYFSTDPGTKAIAMHVESLRGDARAFFDLLDDVSREKPTIILKSGRTPSGSKAASSHTGSMARENHLIFDGMLNQTAAIRAKNMEEFFDLAKAFESLEVPTGKGMAIIMMSGGEGVMATDACELNGFELAVFGDETRQKMQGILPPWKIPLNPLDNGVCMEFNTDDPVGFFESLSAIPEDENVDCLIMQLPPNFRDVIFSSPYVSEEEAGAILDEFTKMFLNMKKPGKTVALWRASMGLEEQKWIRSFEAEGLPVFESSERAIRAIAAMRQYSSRRIKQAQLT
jgi:acyl-CoA synthetase (NDP forming)